MHHFEFIVVLKFLDFGEVVFFQGPFARDDCEDFGEVRVGGDCHVGVLDQGVEEEREVFVGGP